MTKTDLALKYRFSVSYRGKASYSSGRPDLRAVVPEKISFVIASLASSVSFLPGF